MKLLITGARNQNNYDLLKKGVREIERQNSGTIEKILHGNANGIDKLAQKYADDNEINTMIIEPDYSKFGSKYAPIERNKRLVEQSEIVLAIYGKNGKIGGTAFTANFAVKNKKMVVEIWEDGTIKITAQRTLF
jgi:hypothetical protein